MSITDAQRRAAEAAKAKTIVEHFCPEIVAGALHYKDVLHYDILNRCRSASIATLGELRSYSADELRGKSFREDMLTRIEAELKKVGLTLKQPESSARQPTSSAAGRVAAISCIDPEAGVSDEIRRAALAGGYASPCIRVYGS